VQNPDAPRTAPRRPHHPGGNPGANLNSISHRSYLFEVAFVWKLTKETIHLPLGCLQGGSHVTLPLRTIWRPPLHNALCLGCASKSQQSFRGTSLIRTPPPVAPYCRPMPMVLGWSYGRGLFLMNEVPL